MNGQAKIDFVEWVKKEYPLLGIDDILPQICINALKIDFFDSVGIYISINYVNFVNELTSAKGFESMITDKNLTTRFREVKTRQQATEQAIEKAVEIYNNLKNNL
jgi:hypothetical protein